MTWRIVILKPCCIGDVIFATPLLTALRRAWPDAKIDWAVGATAIDALRDHRAINHLIDTGPLANPASKPGSLVHLIRALRAGKYDLAVVPDRSPLLGLATLLAGIPKRAGLDSAGRGFAYTIKAPITPSEVRHEAEIYLDVARALNISTQECWANVPVSAEGLTAANALLHDDGLIDQPFIIVHPGGGVNAGMTMTQKRWPADRFAALADRVADHLGAKIVLIGAPSDKDACEGFLNHIQHPVIDFSQQRLSLSVIGVLASQSRLYVGNDNGLGHLAAASGARVIMIFGPSDPRRYAPFVPADRALALWRHIQLPEAGVSAGAPMSFDWARDGISADEAWEKVRAFV